MVKFYNIALLCTCCAIFVEGAKPNIKYASEIEISSVERTFRKIDNEICAQCGPDIIDFLDLIDKEKVMAAVMQHIRDPEVLNFINFLFGPDFKNLVFEFESMEEFKEAFIFLSSKGYDFGFIIDYVNSILNLPPFESNLFLRSKKGISGLIEAVIEALPVEEMKELFESKLESSPEIAELFNTINSEEFLDIMKRMSMNPKFLEFKKIFESYGFDFKYLCSLVKEIFGKYFQAARNSVPIIQKCAVIHTIAIFWSLGKDHAALIGLGPNGANKSRFNVNDEFL